MSVFAIPLPPPTHWGRVHSLATRLVEGDGPEARRFENLIPASIDVSLVHEFLYIEVPA